MLKRIIILNLVVLFWGCVKQKNAAFIPAYNVPPEFRDVVSGFVQQAALRGHTLFIDNLIIKYDSSMAPNYCALCNDRSLDPATQKIITVNPNVHCYNNAQEREALFFHELGHCILGRDHDNNLLPNGDPKSLMFPDNLTLYSACKYAIGGSCQDNSFKRNYYLDELFNSNTPAPPWAH